MRGQLDVYVGPMYAGKTSKLLQRVLWLSHQRKKVLVIKPSKDDRYSESEIVTHNQLSHPCMSVKSTTEFDQDHNVIPEHFDTICLDEAQFFDTKETVAVVEKWLSAGVNVVAVGLDQDSRGVPFETVALLMSLSDSVEKIAAVCTKCGAPATKTYRLKASGDRVQVGSMGMYEPRCTEHWEPK
jgi:thymidine kinase